MEKIGVRVLDIAGPEATFVKDVAMELPRSFKGEDCLFRDQEMVIFQDQMIEENWYGIRLSQAREVTQRVLGLIDEALATGDPDNIYRLLEGRDSPLPQGFFKLPSGHSAKASLVDHLMLTSAFAVGLMQEILLENPSVQSFGLSSIKSADELIELARLAALLHDLDEYLLSTGTGSAKDLQTLSGKLPHKEIVMGAIDAIKKIDESRNLFGRVLFTAHLLASDRNENISKEGLRQDSLVRFQQEVFGGKKPLALLTSSAIKVKGYVFESSKLPEIRGASRILDMVNLKIIKQRLRESFNIMPEAFIYAAGGNVLAVLPSKVAQQAAETVERIYAEETYTAQSVAVSHEYDLIEFLYGNNPLAFWKEDLKTVLSEPRVRSYFGEVGKNLDEKAFMLRKRFGELADIQNYLMRRRRESRDSLAFFEAGPFARLCSSCQTRPASEEVGEGEGDFTYLCPSCSRKRKEGRRERAQEKRPGDWLGWVEKFEDFLDGTQAGGEYYREHKKVVPAADLDEIGRASSPAGFIGLIYADGNNVGALVERIAMPSEFRHFSLRLYKCTQKAVFNALARHIRPVEIPREDKSKVAIHPFEIITIGGDDVFLIVPADKALEIADAICQDFQEEFKSFKIGRPAISLSAGVVIAHDTAPIYYLRELVEQLLKSAKKGVKRLPEEAREGTIDFMVLNSPSTFGSGLEDFREDILELEKGNEKLKLTRRPYTLSELKELLASVEMLRGARFPLSQLYALRQAIGSGRMPSNLFYKYQQKRFAKIYDPLRQVLEDKWRQDGLWRSVLPQGRSAFDTVVVDLLEIYKVSGGGQVE